MFSIRTSHISFLNLFIFPFFSTLLAHTSHIRQPLSPLSLPKAASLLRCFVSASLSLLLPSLIINHWSSLLHSLTQRHLCYQSAQSPVTVSDVVVCKQPLVISVHPDAQNAFISDQPATQHATTCSLQLLWGSSESEGSACISDALLSFNHIFLRSLLSIFSLLLLLQLSTHHISMT